MAKLRLLHKWSPALPEIFRNAYIDQMKNLPIGIQAFTKLIEMNCIYVDKTQLIHRLVTKGSYYFLARSRRFRKSLLIST